MSFSSYWIYYGTKPKKGWTERGNEIWEDKEYDKEENQVSLELVNVHSDEQTLLRMLAIKEVGFCGEYEEFSELTSFSLLPKIEWDRKLRDFMKKWGIEKEMNGEDGKEEFGWYVISEWEGG